MTEGRSSRWIFSKKLEKLQLECNINLGPASQGGRNRRQGLNKRVSEIVFIKLNEKKPRDKSSVAKKSVNKPFVENLSK